MNDTNNRFKLSYVIMYNPKFHGFDSLHTNSLYYSYLNYESIDIDDFYNDINDIYYYQSFIYENITKTMDLLTCQQNIQTENIHPYIPMYKKLINSSYTFGIQIIEQQEINNTYVGIIKTHWIRLIQRKWRELLKKRKKMMMNPNNLFYREIHGRFPKICNEPFKLEIIYTFGHLNSHKNTN